MTPKEIVCVIAGNYRQFEQWRVQQVIGPRYIYISQPEQLLGLHNVRIELVGTWRERDDILPEAYARGLLVRQ